MKKLILLVTIISFAIIGTSVVVQADAAKGQKLFKKKFRKSCRFSGVRFARYHTQEEWEALYNEGKFPEEAKKICPRLELGKIKPSWWSHIYDFSYEYATDSSHLPSC
ncbi:MAG: hypothetical protein DRG30_03900 [Epsilonproteobacteria bacterium]|nr:MAG: hypothetical protein DRG30_03900 [Campylobacterota bacterium]